MSAEPITIEDALEQFLATRERGEALEPQAFVARYPHLAPDLASAIESLVALESMSSVDVDLTVPDRIGPYRVVREVGRGGMGVVLEAIEEPLERRVALKVLPAELVASPSARARFRREAELAARLDHSGVATVFGAGVDQDRPWIAMRFVDGETLSKAIARARADHDSSVRLSRSPTKEREAVLAVAACLAKVARALQTAHEQGVLHRDVKPSNIIVTPEGQPVLVDFGLAITEESDGHSLTRTGETAGTPAYLAPEIVDGEIARPDAQCDVYALGVTLYECLSLRRPFDAPTPIALYRAIVSGVAPELRSVNKSVPRDLAVVVATAMERDRRRRYRNAAALADDLEACVDGRPIAARPVPFAGRVTRWARREPRQALLAGALAVSAISLAVFGGNWWASRDEVHAAERVARDIEREETLLAGFVELNGGSNANEMFSRVLASDPSNLEALAGRVLACIFGNRRQDGLAVLVNAPHSPGFDALRSYCNKRRITQADELGDLAKAPTLDLFLIGVCLTIEADSAPSSSKATVRKRALELLNEATIRSPRARSFLHISRAFAAQDAHDERMVRSASSALATLWPDSFHAVYTAGMVLVDLDPASALPLLERARELDRNAPEPPHELSIVYRDLGDLEASERWAWIALDRAHKAETYNVLGISLVMRGCIDEARVAWNHAVSVDPRNANAWMNLGQAAHMIGDLDAAKVALTKTVELDPLNPTAHGFLGMIALIEKDLSRAREYLEMSVALNPNQPDMWEQLAWAQIDLRDRPAALASIEAGLSIAPDYAPLLELRATMGQ